MLPGDDVIGCEDQVQERGVVKVARAEPAHSDSARQAAGGCGVEEHHRDRGPRLAAVLLDHGPREGRRVVLEQMKEAGHQKTRKREAFGTSAAMSWAVMGMTGWPSGFQSGSTGSADCSMWNGIPSFWSEVRNLAMSSPSTSSSVSSSSRWTAGPVSTTVTAFSPATMPSAMRMASLARWDARGSSEMMISVGCPLVTRGPAALVQGDEAFRAVDQVGQHHEAAVGGLVGERQPTLLAAVGAHEQLEAAAGQGLQPRVLDGRHGVVDEVEVDVRAAIERRSREAERRFEVGVLRRGRHHETEFSFREVHSGVRVTS